MYLDKEEREIYENDLKALRIHKAEIKTAEEKGIEKERERVEKEKIEKIERTLKKGYSLDVITEILGVTIKKVENIKKKMEAELGENVASLGKPPQRG